MTAMLEIGVVQDRVQALYARAPRVMFKHLRDAFGSIFGSHRREWLARTEVRFQPGGMRAMQPTSRASSASGYDASRSVVYKVTPDYKEPPPGARPNLSEISGETFSLSKVHQGLETGGTFANKDGGKTPIPIGITLDSQGRPKSRWTTPTRFRKASSANKILIPLKTKRGSVILYWKKRTARGMQGPGHRAFALLPAFQLVDRVHRKPRLRYYATWDALKEDRNMRLTRSLERTVKEVENGHA